MAIPATHFYRNGAYWGFDGTGPYAWNGTSMVAIPLAGSIVVGEASTALAVPNRFAVFTPEGEGPMHVTT